MDFGFFPGDLRQQSSFSDLGFNGFCQSPSSSSARFHFSGDYTTPPIINPFLSLDTTALMADTDLGLSQNLSKMAISDERSSFLRNLHGQGLVQSFNGEPSLSGYGDFHRLEDDLRVPREGFRQRFHGESSTSGYVGGDGDYHRLRLLGLQEAYNPNTSFNHHRGFTENLSRYMFEQTNQQIRRDISLIPEKSQLAPLMYSGNRIVPPFSAIGGSSRELGASAKSMMKRNSSFDCNGKEQDLAVNLESMVDIYGSVYLMTKDQLGCRFLQKIIEEGSFVDVMIVFNEVINDVIELGMDPFGNYFIQKLLDVCNEEQRTQILVRLTSKPGLLVKISINTYG